MNRHTPLYTRTVAVASALILLAAAGCAAPAERAAECLRNGEYESVISIAGDALAGKPSDPELYALRAQANWRMNRIRKAEDDLESALKYGLKKGAYHILRAQIRMYECDYKAAAAEAEAAEKEMPGSSLPCRMKKDALARGNAIENRVLFLEKTLSSEKDSSRREMLAVALAKLDYCARNRPAAAIALLEKEIKTTPDHLIAADTLAWMRMMTWIPALRKPEQAIAIARANLKKHPDNLLFLDTAAAAEAHAGNAEQAVLLLKKSFLQIKNLIRGNSHLIPILQKDFERKSRCYSAGKPYLEPRGSVRFLWLLEKMRELRTRN